MYVARCHVCLHHIAILRGSFLNSPIILDRRLKTIPTIINKVNQQDPIQLSPNIHREKVTEAGNNKKGKAERYIG
jgi:hypothetical protein